MVITIGLELEAALNKQSLRRGVAAETLAVDALREKFLGSLPSIEPQNDWERRLLALARHCGVSLSNATLSREEMYE